MIVPQYRPQLPETSNELHQLTLMRMQARKDADEAHKRLANHVHGFLHPNKKSSALGLLISSLPAIISGISIGKRLISATRHK